MFCLYGVTYTRGSTSLRWKLANRDVSSVRIETCEERKHCSKLVIHNLMHNDTGFYTCSHQKSSNHEVSTYVFVKGKIIRIPINGFSIDTEIVQNWFSKNNTSLWIILFYLSTSLFLVTNDPYWIKQGTRPFPSNELPQEILRSLCVKQDLEKLQAL